MTTTPPTRDELIAALANGDRADPLARQIAASLDCFRERMTLAVKRAGQWPEPLVLPPPHDEIDAFALELLIGELKAAGVRVVLKSDA